MRDIVLDTNVLAHAGNPHVPYQTAALDLLDDIRSHSTVLCVDEHNDSRLVEAEYDKHVRAMSPGRAFFTQMYASGRVHHIGRSVSQADRKAIRNLVPGNKRDRTFLAVALNSQERVLASHDFDDFPDAVRAKLQQRLAIQVLVANECQVLPPAVPQVPESAD